MNFFKNLFSSKVYVNVFVTRFNNFRVKIKEPYKSAYEVKIGGKEKGKR